MIIEEADGGATFHAETDGGEESCVARIIIGTGVPTTNDVDKSSALGGPYHEQQYLAASTFCG